MNFRDQIHLMMKMLEDEMCQYPPFVPGHEEPLARKVLSGKKRMLVYVLDLFQKGAEEERNRDKEIWTHFLTILDTQREDYRAREWEEDEHVLFPDETLTHLRKSYILYLKSHLITLPEGDTR